MIRKPLLVSRPSELERFCLSLGHQHDPLLKCHDCAIAGAIGVDHERVVSGAPRWRCNWAYEAPCGNVAPYQWQRCQRYTQTLHGGGKLKIDVVELDMTSSPQIGRTGFSKPVRPRCSCTGGVQQGLPAQIRDALYRVLAQQRRAAGGQTQVGHQRARSDTRTLYMGGAAEYTRLATAERINADAAQESASWGAFQIMGFHWKRLQYSSIADFVARMHQSEGDHLDAFVRFIAADPALLAALKARKFAAFAKDFNGPDYAHNLYDAKLAQAYAKYAGTDKAAA